MTKAKAYLLRKLIEKAAKNLTDEEALSGIELYPKWDVDKDYVMDERVRHNDKLYRVVQAHKSQWGWEPDAVPALFTEVALPGTIAVWRQPTGAQDAYMTGDKVKYPDENGDVWVSTADNNVWQPGVFGWEQVVE